MTERDPLGTIDHAVLRPDCTRGEVLSACALAGRLGVAGVCVHPRWVATAASALNGSEVAVGSVAGFPLGATTTEAKCLEAMQAFESGAREVDMVLAVTALKSGDFRDVLLDIAAVVQVAREVSPRVMVYAMLDTLKYLYYGGRIGRAAALVGAALQIKPILYINDNTVDVLAKPRTRSRALRVMLDEMARRVDGRPVHVAVLHADAAAEADLLRAERRRQVSPAAADARAQGPARP